MLLETKTYQSILVRHNIEDWNGKTNIYPVVLEDIFLFIQWSIEMSILLKSNQWLRKQGLDQTMDLENNYTSNSYCVYLQEVVL